MLRGKIVAGQLVRLACKRHFDDLRFAEKRGFRFDKALAQRAIEFFPDVLCLAEGEHAEQPFRLSPFQQFCTGSLFGWVDKQGYRRFNTAYIEIGKGNGKSPWAAGIGIYGMIADDEPGAQIYSAATTRDQAKIVWCDAEKMIEASPSLTRRIVKTVNNLAFPPLQSFFRPVASDHSKLDGFRPHMVIADEVHEHPSALVIDKMRAGFKGRRQPLIIEITNSGVDRKSICFQHHEYSRKVLEGSIQNDAWFAYVCALDVCAKCAAQGKTTPADDCEDCDDWRDERTWIKANPNLGVSVTLKYLREQVKEACEMPSKQNIVRRLNFCQWTEQVTRWLDMTVWDCNDGAVDVEALKGRECYGGIDLATTTDIAALVLVFPTDEEDADQTQIEPDEGVPPRLTRKASYDVLTRFWVPADNILVRARRDRVPFDVWRDKGLITATPGNVVDYDQIRADVRELAETFNLVELAFDPWNATQLSTQLGEGDGIAMVQLRQGFISMNEPTKEVEKLLLGKKLRHGGNPVLRWMASNVAVKQDAAGNIKPDKSKSTERIDGIVALVMAIARASLRTSSTSIYETRGVIKVGTQ